MPWAAAAAVVGAGISASASSKASKAQQKGADKADATQRYQYDTTRADNAPFRETGLAANNKLAYLLGIDGGGRNSTGVDGPGGEDGGFIGRGGSYQGDPTNPWLPGGPSAGVNYGYDRKRYGWSSDWGTPDPGVNAFTGGQAFMGEKGTDPTNPWVNGDVKQGINPDYNYAAHGWSSDWPIADPGAEFFAGGEGGEGGQRRSKRGSLLRNFAESDLRDDAVLNAEDGYMTKMRDITDADIDNDVVYKRGLQFGLDEGRRGIENQSSAMGNMLSGATLKALTRFGNDYGETKSEGAYNRFQTNQNYKYGLRNDSFNRYTSNQDRTYNKLAGMSGAGQVATNQISAAGQNMANNVSQNQLAAGTAKSAGYIAQGNAWNNAIGSTVNNWQQNRLLDSYNARTSAMNQPTQQQQMLNDQWR